MATTINLTSENNIKNKGSKEIKERFATPGRKPDKALDGMYGLWQNITVSIEQIRDKKRRKKW